MRTKSERIRRILRDHPDQVFDRRTLKRLFNSLYADQMSDGSINKIMDRIVSKNCLRTPTQTASGYLYTYNDHELLQKVYEEYLLPYEFPNRRMLLELMQTQDFCKLEENSSSIELAQVLSLLVGFGIGDGNLRREDDKNYCVSFFLYLRHDAELLKGDLERHFAVHPKVVPHTGCFAVRFSCKFFHSQLASLGMPVGNKVRTEFLVPEWIYHGEQHLKRAFLRGIFGAEGSKPFNGKSRIQFVISKDGLFIENLLAFLNQIRAMLHYFGINTTNIQVRTQPGRAFHGRFYITGRDNVMRFYEELGFAYASEKQEVLDALVGRYKKERRLLSACAQ